MPQYTDYVSVARYPATLGFPLPAGTWRFRSGYGDRLHPIYKEWRLHDGVDLPAALGVPVLAAADGVVVGRRWDDGAGNYLTLRHTTASGEPLFTEYLHLSAFLVPRGKTVRRGEVIARVGSTGASTGPHLHFRVNFRGRTLNPEPMLGLAPSPPAQSKADAGTMNAVIFLGLLGLGGVFAYSQLRSQ